MHYDKQRLEQFLKIPETKYVDIPELMVTILRELSEMRREIDEIKERL